MGRPCFRLFTDRLALSSEVASLDADVRFVNFDDSHQLLEFKVVHRGAYAMTDIPSCLLFFETQRIAVRAPGAQGTRREQA